MKAVKTYSPKTKILSLILSFLIVFYLVPTSVFAEAMDSDTTVSDSSVSENEENSTYTPEIYEVTELREENVKHFRLSDGSYVAAQYNYPVHYTDESGQLADIDNRLIDSGSEFSTNNSRVKFIKKITGNGNIFTLHENNTKITIGLVGAEKKIEGVVTENNNSDDAIESALGKMTNLENLSSTIVYEDILDGVDIEYIVHSLNIKENIIVKEKRDNYSYTFTIELNNLTANLADNGNVYITSLDGETQYIIPAPVVYDANGTYAPKDVSAYTLSTTGNRKYELTVSVSSNWMNADERVFPVTVDPAMLSPGGQILDLNIDSSSPDSNNNGALTFYVSSTQRAYLKFNENYFTTVPTGTTITKAELSLMGNTVLHGSARVGVYPIISDWDSTLTWNKTLAVTPQGTFDNTPLDYAIVNRSDTRYTWDITPLYKDWLAGGTNYGVGLKLISESSVDYAQFSCYENQDASNYRKPIIMVTYISNDGLESYYPTVTHSAGTGGVGSINLATGRMTLAIPTLTTTDSLFAFTPTLVYNSSLAGKNVTSAYVDVPFSTSYMPMGFKLNIQETIVKKNYKDNSNATHYYYALYDADGTTHNFFTDDNTKYYDDGGLRLTLTSSGDNLLIEDTSHTIRTYSKINSTSWHLTSITDMYGNQLIFEFNTSYQPTKVIVKPNGLSNIEILQLLYEGNKLCAVYNDASKDSVILRYSGGNLATVQYCYSNDNSITDQDVKNKYINSSNETSIVVYATATYTYDSSGNITKITDSYINTNKSLRYEITNGKITKLSEYAGTALGQQVSYFYGEGYTDVRSTGNNETLNNDDDIITRYVFDSYGRTVSAYSMSSNGSEIYGATAGTYETQENIKNNLKDKIALGGSSVNHLLNGGFEKNADHWTLSSSMVQPTVESNFEGEGTSCLTFSPVAGQPAFAKQRIKLRSGSYTLSMLVGVMNCEGYSGKVSVVNVGTNATIHSENISINTLTGVIEPTYFTTTFKVSSSSEFVTLDLIIQFETAEVNENVKIQIDRVMLENHIGSADYSLIEYGSFDTTTIDAETDEYEISSAWVGNFGIITDTSPFKNVLKIENAGSASGMASQRVFEASESDLNAFDNSSNNEIGNIHYDEYIVSAFAKAENALPSSNGKFRIAVNVAYYQGADEQDIIVNHYFDYVPDCKEWQFVCGRVPTKIEDTDTAKYNCIRYIDVSCEYFYQIGGYALFDNISFVYATANTLVKYGYNENGNLQYTDNMGIEEYYYYNNNNDVTKVINNQNQLTVYTYFENKPWVVSTETNYVHNIDFDDFEPPEGKSFYEGLGEAVVETKKTSITYTYDNYGLCTSTTLNQYDPTVANSSALFEKITETFVYYTEEGSKIFGALQYSIDSLQNKTTYVYDEDNGQLLITGYDDYSAIMYDYDGAGRLINASPGRYYGKDSNMNTNYQSSDVDYEYSDEGILEKIITDSTEYTISYNNYLAESGISIGDRTLATYEYYPNNGKLKKINYGNGFSEEYVYNTLEMLAEVWYTYDDGTRVLAYEYEYTSYGQLGKIVDNLSGKTTIYRYDSNGKIILSGQYDSGEYELYSEYIYDDLSRPSKVTTQIGYSVGNNQAYISLSQEYGYNDYGLLCTFKTYGANIGYSYDSLNRLTNKTVSYTASGSTPTYTNEISYSYKTHSYFVSEYQNKVKGITTSRFTYTYDSKGNITKITDKDGKEINYYYDTTNKLSSVIDNIANKEYIYHYDNAGNITSIVTNTLSSGGGGGDLIIYALNPTLPSNTTTFSYTDSEWGDLLTAYNGHTITYDEIGNPLSYYNGSAYTFTWDGRRLASVEKGLFYATFTYNDEGLRLSKTVEGETTTYLYDGSVLIAEYAPNYTCVYIYDESGSVIGAKYISTSAGSSWQTYFFEKNLQGDVIAVYSDTGTKLVSYRYDAWGNVTTTYHNGGASTLAANNPIRYRSYYYDTALQMYYLQSRYYDAKICRFINADSYVSTGQGLTGYNMFAYCNNNPVNCVDHSGESALGIVLLLLLGVGALGVLTSCENPDANNLYDTYGDVGDVLGFVDDSVQFGEDLTIYKKYEYSYSMAVSRYYQTNANELYWDEYLEEAFSNDKEKCIDSIEGDIALLRSKNKKHLPYINDVEYLYSNFGEWATYGSRNILVKSLQPPMASGLKWYQDIWGFIFGFAN